MDVRAPHLIWRKDGEARTRPLCQIDGVGPGHARPVTCQVSVGFSSGGPVKDVGWTRMPCETQMTLSCRTPDACTHLLHAPR